VQEPDSVLIESLARFLFALKAGLYAPEAAHWVRNQGRMKYCRPTYRAIYQEISLACPQTPHQDRVKTYQRAT
jgi:hypothetical protein